MRTYYKLTKTEARAAYDSGKMIFMLPSKCRLGNPWVVPCSAVKGEHENDTFDRVVSDYKYWNCNDDFGHGIRFYEEA